MVLVRPLFKYVQEVFALSVARMLVFLLVLLFLASTNDALQCACNTPFCSGEPCTAESGGQCYKRVVTDGNGVSVTQGCFERSKSYLCNSSSEIYATACCTAYDSCNRDMSLAPKAATTSPGLQGINGPPLTCLQSNASSATANRCTTLPGYCYVLATRTNNSVRYEQGCTQTCVPQTTQNVQKSCCSTDQCNVLPLEADASATNPPSAVLYSCYCTAPECNGLCVSTAGCYVDVTTGSQGCISPSQPCPAANRTCCSEQWCNTWSAEVAVTTTTPSRPFTTSPNATRNSITATPQSSPQNNLPVATRGGAGPVASDRQLVQSKPFQALVTMVLVLCAAIVISLLTYFYIKWRRSPKRPDPQLQQFIETSV